MLKILVLEDHPMMVESIKASLRNTSFKVQAYVAHSLRDLDHNPRLKAMPTPDLIVTDLNVPDSQGWPTLRYLRDRYPHVAILVFSQNSELHAEKMALSQGADAYVNKSRHPQIFVRKLQEMLVNLHEGLPQLSEDGNATEADHSFEDELMHSLTQQQTKVLNALASGLSTREIAAHLVLHEQTVRSYLTEIYHRLQVKNRSQAIVFYLRWKSHHEL
jgi:DNA-binding NarL/FixJ family response regulator